MFLKRIFRAIAWFILGSVTFASAWLLAALLLPLFTVNSKPLSGNDVSIYIQTNGDHTDIIVPVKNKIKDWTNEISYQNTTSRDTTCSYVAIGWGDKGFYLNTPTWSQLKFSTAFKAAFWLSTSAIHTTFCKDVHENDDCKKLTLSNEQYASLVNYIENGFKRSVSNYTISIKTTANYDNEDAFYEAKGRYNLFYTCNTWANNALKSCGQKAAFWTVFDVGIFRHYRTRIKQI
jgi:uncharacterized protein (TIGR02117 family)